MSWSIYATGTKKGVIKAVKDTIVNEHTEEKAFVLSQLEKVGDKQVVRLEASGSTSQGHHQVAITITPIGHFYPDPPEPEAATT